MAKLTMQDYVVETPAAVVANINNSKKLTESLVKEFCARDYKRIIIVACGSSYNGSFCAQPFLEKVFKKEVKVIPPFTFVNFKNDVKPSDFVMVVSQSGRSTNAIEALEVLKAKGHRTIGITGDLNSDFSDICDLTVEWGIGIEKVGFVTKGVVTLALFFMLFSIEAQLALGKMSEKKAEKLKAELLKTVDAHKELQANTWKYIASHEKQVMSLSEVFTVGSGANLATATEAALKVSETCIVHATAYETEEFLHGPLFPMNPEYMVILYETGNKHANARIEQIYEAVSELSSRAVLVKCGKSKDPNVITTSVKLMDEVMPLAYLAVAPLIAEIGSNHLTKERHVLMDRMRAKASTKSDKIPRGWVNE